ncbi:4-hydroxy-3-methylbut-2-enyl diphosphate reductase [Streptomyces sp. NPDC052236]|uniref:4-hydroxy-3-methylbut-2-enyl diphosphate reductase n=1 Tax=Streptomyces sp. NPDC052236 TaxID=3365686 RepID=UPI0037D78E1F
MSSRILLASPRGYCAGVDRAVQVVEQALARWGPPVYVRHEIVHNKYVVRALEAKGAVFVDQCHQAPPGARVIFSAHGIAPDVHDEAAARHLRTIDATCPLVTKVHKEALRYAEAGYDILLIGHAGHEEVIGTMGEAPDRIHLVNGPDEAATVSVRDPDKVVWLSQTTLSVDEAMATVEALKARFPALVAPPGDDICYATQNRQQAIKEIAPHCGLVLVVGSTNSSNSRRLVEVALAAGAPDAHLIDTVSELDEAWLTGVETIGVTSGASVPEILVTQLLDHLAAQGYTDIETPSTIAEPQTFALPRSLSHG